MLSSLKLARKQDSGKTKKNQAIPAEIRGIGIRALPEIKFRDTFQINQIVLKRRYRSFDAVLINAEKKGRPLFRPPPY